jgi:hypothetical protein
VFENINNLQVAIGFGVAAIGRRFSFLGLRARITNSRQRGGGRFMVLVFRVIGN